MRPWSTHLFPPCAAWRIEDRTLPISTNSLTSLSAKFRRADALLLLPGEDPFYYATGRIPQFPVTLFDPTTDPYSAPELLAEARRRNVRWVIVKRVAANQRETRCRRGRRAWNWSPRDYALYRRLEGYDIYREAVRKRSEAVRAQTPRRSPNAEEPPDCERLFCEIISAGRA